MRCFDSTVSYIFKYDMANVSFTIFNIPVVCCSNGEYHIPGTCDLLKHYRGILFVITNPRGVAAFIFIDVTYS